MAEDLPDSLFRVIIERTGLPFVIVDTAGEIVFAGDSVAAVLGWKPADVIGRNMADFLDPPDVELALAGMAEIDSVDRIDASVPIVLPIRGPDGRPRHTEVAAVPLQDVSDRQLTALRLRSWDAQRHLSDFVRALLTGVTLEEGLEALTASLAGSMEGVGATVHHGFDGTTFQGVVGSWPEAATLPLTGPPWTDAIGASDVLEVSVDHAPIRAIGAVTGWLVPVRPTSGPLPAVLSIWRDRPDPPYIGHRRAFAHAADFVELALVRSAEHDRLVHLARHDSLTGVGNRATFRDQLSAALALGETNIAVGFCDLDDFKLVNDRLGHREGDDLLVDIAARIRSTLRAGDDIARIGGDEFTILWREIPDEAAAAAVAERVVAAGAVSLCSPEGTMPITISIGYVLARPGATADSLLAAADAALYQSKQQGGGRATRGSTPAGSGSG